MSGFMWRLAGTVLPALAVGAAAVWVAYSRARRRGVEATHLAVARALLVVVVATLLTWTLLLANPGADGTRALNLAPFREIARALRSADAGYGVVNLWGNILVFVPVGILALLSMRPMVRLASLWAFLAGVGLSVGIEAAQYAIGRSADIDDVLLNAIGIAIGVTGAVTIRRTRQRSMVPANPEEPPLNPPEA